MELSPLIPNLIAIAAIITGAAIGAWWIIVLYGVHSRKEEKELPEVELPAHLHEVFTGIPPVIVVFIAFIFGSGLLYVLYIWLGGTSY